jgi:hypothetical protein
VRSKVSPLAVRRPWNSLPYHEATPLVQPALGAWQLRLGWLAKAALDPATQIARHIAVRDNFITVVAPK